MEDVNDGTVREAIHNGRMSRCNQSLSGSDLCYSLPYSLQDGSGKESSN